MVEVTQHFLQWPRALLHPVIMIRAPLASEQEEGQDESRDNPEDAIPYGKLFVSTSVIVPSTQL